MRLDVSKIPYKIFFNMNREREQVYKDKLLEIVNYPKDNIIFIKNFLNNFWKFLKSPINFASRYKCNQVLEYVDKVRCRPFTSKLEIFRKIEIAPRRDSRNVNEGKREKERGPE